MRTYHCIILSLSFVNLAAFAEAQPSTQQAHASLHLGMEISGDVLGQHYTTYVLPSDITNGPVWSVAKGGEPPVSMQEAIKSAKEALPRTITDSPCWSLGGIEMEEWPGSESDYAPGKGHWFYKIDLDGPSQSKMTIVVLMNGRAICPQKQGKAKEDMAGGTSMGIFGSINGHQYSTYVRDSDVDGTPIWSASEEKPPVSAGEAAKLARNALSKALGDTSSWNLSNVTLKEWPESGHWIYTVGFDGPSYRVPNIQGSFESGLTIVVLMNGNTLVPKPEKTK
jgi:hypothetical protein